MKINKQFKKQYKVVFLDWNGTISSSKFWGHLEDINHPNNRLFSKIESVLFGKLRHLLKPWMTGQTTSEKVIRQISDKTDLSYEMVMKEFIESCKQMKFGSGNLNKLIQQLRASGTKVVIATDNMDSFPRWTIPSLALTDMFDDILDSYTLKAMKGDFDENGKNLFFSDYLSKNNIQPGESTLIDDSEDKENRIANIGIEYRKIEPIVGLEPELVSILNLLG